MPFELNFMPHARLALQALLDDPDQERLADAVDALLDRLEVDPGDPTLGTTNFVTPTYEHVRSTPVRRTGWVIVWQLAPTDRQLDILFVGDPSDPVP